MVRHSFYRRERRAPEVFGEPVAAEGNWSLAAAERVCKACVVGPLWEVEMRRMFVLVVGLALAATACGDSGATTTSTGPAQPPATTTTAGTSTTAAGGGAAGDVSAARGAVVQIVAKGTFVDPFEGVQANVPGSGSGFVIDPSGIAVTNNHVVTGAALLEVYLDGEDAPRNARVLGVSECSDLAVIDIAGPDLPYLEWYDGQITAGLDIFAAGYPLGDPEYTLLDGIVSKEDAGGETTWASVDAVIEHSADTLPGNSGGPILTADGKVVAVNYAGNDLGQSFAIGREVARPVVDRLAAGEDVDSIGVNGEALLAGGFSGIWVYSVESGSPADRAGIAAGDLILSLEGLDLAVDGTMAEYCDVLRSHSPDDVLAVEVYRQSTDEILAGQLNGDVMEPAFSFASELGGVTDTPAAGPAGYEQYVEVADDSGLIRVSVPAEWSDTLGAAWTFDGELIGPAVSAAPDLDGFAATWGTPGVFIAASDRLPLSRAELLDGEDFSSACTFVERLDYDDGLYVGEFDVWEDCGDAGSTFLVVAAEPPDGAFAILVQIVIVDERDFAAADEIINTFIVSEDLGLGGGGPPPTGPQALASGLRCADVADLGFWYGDAAAYWLREGRPARMDADGNGIPCETVYDGAQIDAFYAAWFNEPSGLLCADLAAAGYVYGDALAYWIAEGTPNRMDIDTNGIPCETVYDSSERDPFLSFEFNVG